jgi:hypothetical protein
MFTKVYKKSPAITAGLSLFNHFKDQRNKLFKHYFLETLTT